MSEPIWADEPDAEGDMVHNFHGFLARECGEHRTTGSRAWCFSCSTWCYPMEGCPGCKVPALERQLEEQPTPCGICYALVAVDDATGHYEWHEALAERLAA